MGYKIIVIVSGVIALICTYLVYMAFAAGDHSGMGLFAAFGLMFAALLFFYSCLPRSGFLGQETGFYKWEDALG
jgi:hypothetical protein